MRRINSCRFTTHFENLEQVLHIVCFDPPWPADNGYAIDVMNRIRAFHKLGVQVRLHYFCSNNAPEHPELNFFCKTINTYKKKPFNDSFLMRIPFFVASRINKELIDNLNKDAYPVLLEGLHTTGILNEITKEPRKICIRLHNNYAAYYRGLAGCTSDPRKKIYYLFESVQAKKYTKTLPKKISYVCISECDRELMQQMGFTNAVHVPAFGDWQKVNSPTGVGNLCLFHGNLADAENEKAAMWLLCNVFNKVRVPFIIAGKNPSRRLQKAAALCQHTCLVSDPSTTELDDLIQKAHINILPFVNKNISGIRLKLLHALFLGRHCVVNPAMVSGTGLEAACHIGHNSGAIAGIVSELYTQPFVKEDIETRERILHEKYNNERNILKFTNLLW